MDSIFRPLVLFSLVLTVIFFITPFFDYMWLSHAEINLLNQSGLGASIELSEAVHWITLFIWVILSLGLFFYIKIAKSAFVVFYLFNLIISPFYGVQVLTGHDMLIYSLLGLSDGVILAMLFLTSVGNRFAKDS